jgi:hypothetical protein
MGRGVGDSHIIDSSGAPPVESGGAGQKRRLLGDGNADPSANNYPGKRVKGDGVAFPMAVSVGPAGTFAPGLASRPGFAGAPPSGYQYAAGHPRSIPL